MTNSPVLATIAIPVTYAPNPATAAILITESGMNEGPFACDASGPAADGVTYTLTASLTTIPAGLVPGKVSVQPGDILADAMFVPAAINGVAVPPVLGDLSLAGAAPAMEDIAWTAGPVQADVSDPESSFLVAGSDGYLHVRITGTDNVDGEPADPSSAAVAMAITQGGPRASDFQAAEWLAVTTPGLAGVYARLVVSGLPGGNYRVYVLLGGTTRLRCPGYLRVGN